MTKFLAVPVAVLHTSACISAKRICTVRFVFPLAGIHNLLCISSSRNGDQNNYKISACGDAILCLHFRKRNCRFWITFPQEGSVNFCVHLRLRCLWTWIITKSQLAGMQYFDCISASETVDSGLYSRKEKCKFLCASPLAGTMNRYYNRTSPLTGMKYFDCIPTSGTVASGSYSRDGEWKNFHVSASPLVGTVNWNYNRIFARGKAIFW